MFRDYGKEIDDLEISFRRLNNKIIDLEEANEVYYGSEEPTYFGGGSKTNVKDKLEALYTHFNLEFNKTKSGIAEVIKPKKGGN